MNGLDVLSPTWRAIERHALSQIAMLREKNDSHSLDAMQTTDIRGRIAAWKQLLALANPAPATEPDVSY